MDPLKQSAQEAWATFLKAVAKCKVKLGEISDQAFFIEQLQMIFKDESRELWKDLSIFTYHFTFFSRAKQCHVHLCRIGIGSHLWILFRHVVCKRTDPCTLHEGYWMCKLQEKRSKNYFHSYSNHLPYLITSSRT